MGLAEAFGEVELERRRKQLEIMELKYEVRKIGAKLQKVEKEY